MTRWALVFGLAMALAAPALAQAPVGPNSRAEAVGIIAGLREIVSPQGLQAIETVPIGGIRQVVSIRSQDLRNPVLIYFHGGPGFVEMPLDLGPYSVPAWASIARRGPVARKVAQSRSRSYAQAA